MRQWVSICAGLLMLGLSLAGQAYAADCPPLRYLGGIPVTFDADGKLGAEAVLNNVPKSAAFGVGYVSAIEQATADELGLKQFASGERIYSSTGKISDTYVTVSQFALGAVAGRDMAFQVVDGISSSAVTLSLSIFGSNDLDMDLGQGRLNIFSPDHCGNSGVYWPAPAVAIVPYEGDMKVPVTIDGHATKAFIGPGDGVESKMGLKDATEIFGLTPDSPGMEIYRFPSGSTAYRHVFSSLSFGGVTIKNASFLIIPEKLPTMFKEKPTGSLISQRKFEGARLPTYIGTNVMRKLHIYVSTKEHKLYIAPTDPAAAKLLRPLAAAPSQVQYSQ